MEEYYAEHLGWQDFQEPAIGRRRTVKVMCKDVLDLDVLPWTERDDLFVEITAVVGCDAKNCVNVCFELCRRHFGCEESSGNGREGYPK